MKLCKNPARNINANKKKKLKNQFFLRAHNWAKAAGRDDLLEKTLKNLIKYYLCAAHFTDDCFTTELKTTLKKTSRPISVPIPTIFESNIEQYVPKSATKTSNYVFSKTIDSAKEYFTENAVDAIQDDEETIQAEEEEEENNPDQFQNYLISTTLQNVEDTLQDNEENEGIIYFQKVSNIDSLENFYLKDGDCVDETMSILESTVDTIDEPKQLFVTCRLCASEFTFDEVVSIFNTEFGIAEFLERLMPNEVSFFNSN